MTNECAIAMSCMSLVLVVSVLWYFFVNDCNYAYFLVGFQAY